MNVASFNNGSSKQKVRHRLLAKSVATGLVGVITLLLVWCHGSFKARNDSTLEQLQCSASIQHGTASNGIAYYHCCQNKNNHDTVSSTDAIQLVLLHGARFTKEDYKTSGLLDLFCSNGASVIALDLSVKASAKDLQTMLEVLVQDGLVNARPISLVTPSASGYGVVDWINTGDLEAFRAHIQHWIPVASPSIANASTERLEQELLHSSILAVYGDKDALGKQVSQRLGKYAGATVVEIPGSHPCYLDSPDMFVTTVMDFVKQH